MAHVNKEEYKDYTLAFTGVFSSTCKLVGAATSRLEIYNHLLS